GLVQKHHHPGRLNNLVWKRNHVRKRQSRRRAQRGWLLLALRYLLEHGRGRRQHRFLAQRNIGEEVEEVFRRKILAQAVNAAREEELLYFFHRGAFRWPDPGKIGLAIETGAGADRFGLPSL